MEPWWVCRSLVAELHHYYEEQDPDQTFHLNANLDPDLLLVKGKKSSIPNSLYTVPGICSDFFLPQFKKKIILNFMIFVATKKDRVPDTV